MKLVIEQDVNDLAAIACKQIRNTLNKAVDEKGGASLLISTGASQFSLFQTLVGEQGSKPVPWDKIDVYHLDEYVGLPPMHTASFCRYIRERFADFVKPREVHYIYGDRDISATLDRMNGIMKNLTIDLGLIGVGENGHIAFNDPPADFTATDPYIIVELNESCKRQQVREGWFNDVDSVPKNAFTMSVRQILKCAEIVSFVPYTVKAEAVYGMLTQDVNNMAPATILKTHPNLTLYLDGGSSEKLNPEIAGVYQ